jgi:hypothetical protein
MRKGYLMQFKIPFGSAVNKAVGRVVVGGGRRGWGGWGR